MRLFASIFNLLFASAIVTAQTPIEAVQSALLKLRAEAANIQSCPVRLTVDRRPQGAVAWVGSSNPAHSTQGLNISIANSPNRIVAADLTVHGYSAGARITPATVPASRGVPESKEMTETFHLTADAGESLTNSPIWTEHLVTVDRIELTRIAYADGSQWQPSPHSRCTAVPSLLVLVNANAH